MSVEGARTLLVERVMTILSVTPHSPGRVEQRGDPVIWILWRILEARRSWDEDKPRILAEILSWAADRLPMDKVLDSIHRDLYSLVKREPGSRLALWSLAKAARRFIENPTLEGFVSLAVNARREIYRPCSRSMEVEAERDKLERVMARIGLVMGALFSLFFILSILLTRIEVIALMILAMGAVWYAVRSYGVRYAMLNAEAAWRECSVGSPEDLRRMLLGYPPMQLLVDLLYDNRSQRQ